MIGERLRAVAFQGADGYTNAATEAMEWYARAMQLNRWDPLARIGYGQCLDWLDRHDEALPYFQQAVALDPNYFHTRGMLAWHYFQTGDFVAADEWNNKSIAMNWTANPQALAYRPLITRELDKQKKAAPR